MDKIALILGLVLIVIVFFAVCISAIVACFLKERKRLVAIDSLLITATLLVALSLGLSLLPSVQQQTSHVKLTKAIKQADSAVNGISESGYAEELGEPTHTVMNLLGAGAKEKELKKADETVQKLSDDFRYSPSIVCRLAVIQHELGKDPKPIRARFEDDDHEAYTDPLIAAMDTLYGKSGASANSDQSSGIDRTKVKALEEVIKKGLPAGWYQRTALLEVYKKYDADALKLALATEQHPSRSPNA